ncbi:MAG: ATP-binding protein [Mycobacteriales bacterium]|nr:ATP-binding protein [Frankia sp.]
MTQVQATELRLRAEMRLPPERRSAAAARRFVAERLAEWRVASVADAAELLTSELVTNAVVHAGTEIGVVVETGRDAVRIEVSDGDHRAPVPRIRPFEDVTTGRGLTLVEMLAARWGVQARDGGKAVWFELSLG